jgi:lipopolysaccharide biosynthesis glycosyltransferase
MNIVLCADHKFIMPCGVLIYSICINNKDISISFFIISDDSLTEEDKRNIEEVSKKFSENNTIQFLFVTDSMVDKILWYKNNYYPKQIFYRLFMTELLPLDIDKVLYLDCDTMVRGSLDDLWNINIENCFVGVTPDGDSGILEIYNRLRYSITQGYFNSGVMLVNLTLWRKDGIFDKIFNYINGIKEKLVLGDQDPMNYLFKDFKVHIPLKYNVQPKFLYKYQYMPFSIYQYKDELDEARVNPVILHYAGCRPWEENCPHPYKEEFYKYQRQTIWKDVPLAKVNIPFKKRIKELIRKWLTPFGFCHYVEDYFDRNLVLKP